MNMTELWEKALVLIRESMTEISFNTWIKTSLSPDRKSVV